MAQTMLQGAPNFRDLGGYRTADGSITRSGLVFRSGHLADLTTSDLERLQALGIRTIIDFRPERERDISGQDKLPTDVDYVTIPIGDPAMAPHVYRALTHGDFSALPDLETGNRTLVRDFGDELGTALRIMSDPKNLPLVVHCIGGKDRTGLAAALLLSILGVPWSTVSNDYLRSNSRLGETAAEQDAFIAKLTKRTGRSDLTDENRLALKKFFVLETAYIEAAWDEIRVVAGTFDQYVERHLGLDVAETGALRELLLEGVDRP